MNKKKTKKFKRSWIKYLVCFGFVAYVGYTVITQQFAINNEKAELEDINKQIEAAESEKAILAEKVNTVNTPEYIEYVARTDLGYASPDEIVFIDSTAKD